MATQGAAFHNVLNCGDAYLRSIAEKLAKHPAGEYVKIPMLFTAIYQVVVCKSRAGMPYNEAVHTARATALARTEIVLDSMMVEIKRGMKV